MRGRMFANTTWVDLVMGTDGDSPSPVSCSDEASQVHGEGEDEDAAAAVVAVRGVAVARGGRHWWVGSRGALHDPCGVVAAAAHRPAQGRTDTGRNEQVLWASVVGAKNRGNRICLWAPAWHGRSGYADCMRGTLGLPVRRVAVVVDVGRVEGSAGLAQRPAAHMVVGGAAAWYRGMEEGQDTGDAAAGVEACGRIGEVVGSEVEVGEDLWECEEEEEEEEERSAVSCCP